MRAITIVAFSFGLFCSGAALADEIGRYQVMAGTVPTKGNGQRNAFLMVDTTTGRTWMLSNVEKSIDMASTKGKVTQLGIRWLPLRIQSGSEMGDDDPFRP